MYKGEERGRGRNREQNLSGEEGSAGKEMVGEGKVWKWEEREGWADRGRKKGGGEGIGAVGRPPGGRGAEVRGRRPAEAEVEKGGGGEALGSGDPQGG